MDHIKYDEKEIIDIAAKQRYEVLAITNHAKVSWHEDSVKYAEEKGILLIPGIEIYLGRKHIVILNCPRKPGRFKSFSDLRKFKTEHPESFIFAPHPYYPAKSCLGNLLEENIDIFDGIEYCHFHLKYFDPFNKKALKIAKKHSKTIIANSDTHIIEQFGQCWTEVESEKKVSSIIKALKKGKTEIFTKPVSLLNFIRVIVKGTVRKKRKIYYED